MIAICCIEGSLNHVSGFFYFTCTWVGETEKGYRTFGIDCIENIVTTNKKFKPKTEEAKDNFSQVIGLNFCRS